MISRENLGGLNTVNLNNYNKVIKLIELSSSQNDNEALSTIRLAHYLVKRSNKSWLDFLAEPYGIIKNNDDIDDGRFSFRDRAINEWYAVLMQNDPNDFTTSVFQQYKKYGGLTDKQFTALRKIARFKYRAIGFQWDHRWDRDE